MDEGACGGVVGAEVVEELGVACVEGVGVLGGEDDALAGQAVLVGVPAGVSIFPPRL